MEIKIRFNTEKDKTDATLPPWRVLANGMEQLAESVQINTASWTSVDEIAPGKIKWHISCVGEISWDVTRRVCTISPVAGAALP